MSASQRFSEVSSVTMQSVQRTGMLLMQAQAPMTLSVESLHDVGRDLVEVARQMRAQAATIQALSDEILEEQALPAPAATVVPFVREVRS
ncbi:MAG: hypothetical protein ABF968_07220 [Acetobacter sp.]|uniref:hypothetical protein n=1 Tax=Acetobacter sp. TaxID=440 RepID=UPI0039EC6619